MKKRLFLFGLFISFTSVGFAQDAADGGSERVVENDPGSFNRWSIEFGAGQAKGIRPYADGFFYSNPEKTLPVDFNHYELGLRYMISPTFGLKLDLAYDNLKNQDNSGSLPFEMQQFRAGIQGVVNAVRLFNFEEQAGRFGLLMHGGVQAARMVPQLGINEGKDEYNAGLMVGITPQFRLTKKFGFYVDVSLYSNLRQHFNWDGSYSELSNNLAGSMFSTSVGFNYSFGREKIHGDWAIIADLTAQELKALDERIGEIETMMNDSDKDGVPDYLDAENNSLAGVAVDAKGRMVDLNKNGVADELEKFMENRISNIVQPNNDGEVVKRLINEGYIAVFFDYNSVNPTPASTQNISFVLTYLRNNISASVDITGFADEIGKAEVNKVLAQKRAESLRAILVKSGIDAARVNVINGGIDNSVDKGSSDARRLVRRALFTIK